MWPSSAFSSVVTAARANAGLCRTACNFDPLRFVRDGLSESETRRDCWLLARQSGWSEFFSSRALVRDPRPLIPCTMEAVAERAAGTQVLAVGIDSRTRIQ